MATTVKQHGVHGVYYGGEWLPLEQCPGVFAIEDATCSGGKHDKCKTCPRSASRPSAASAGSRIDGDGVYDVVIVGAGCIGGAVARELSRYTLKTLVVEAADDVSQGATKGNSGIVHAGYDDAPGSQRAKFCWPGNQMFPQLDRELRFGYQKNGSLVLAFTADDLKHLQELKKRGEQNGVQRLRIISHDELMEMEPHVNPLAIGALHSPDAGNVIPYEYAIALCENACDNGVEFRIRREVVAVESDATGFVVTARHWEPKAYVDSVKPAALAAAAEPPTASNSGGGLSAPVMLSGALAVAGAALAVLGDNVALGLALGVGAVGAFALGRSGGSGARKAAAIKAAAKTAFEIPSVGTSATPIATVEEMKVGGSGSPTVNQGVTVAMEKIRTRFVINCAGSGADAIAALIGDTSFKIKPRLGDYLLMHRNQGHLCHATLFPCPGPLGKGVLVQTTLWGNLILGPTARDVHEPSHMGWTREQITDYIMDKCKFLVPEINDKEVIHAFCGSRAKSTRGDWIIEASAKNRNMIHVAGIDSPGLAGSPSIALEVVRLLQDAGVTLAKNPTFNPNRAPIIVPKAGWKGLKAGPPGTVTDPQMAVICKCEKVTEAEVVTALHRSLPLDSTQGIRKRTRAGMGHCQGDPENYDCECRVAAVIARETGLPHEAVGRRPWPATSFLPGRWHRKDKPDGAAPVKSAL